MRTQKQESLLKDLMQYGYDHNLVVRLRMKGYPELENKFDDFCQECIDYIHDWFSKSEEEYAIDYQCETIMRFCFTAGMGATWWWKFRKEEVEENGLYKCLAEPRTMFEMDEYIEDTIGIGFPDGQSELCTIARRCTRIASSYYDLSDLQQEYEAGLTVMFFGMYCEQTRLYREDYITPHNGDISTLVPIFKMLYGEYEDNSTNSERLDQILHDIVNNTYPTAGKFVLTKSDTSESGWVNNYYVAYTKNINAGVKLLCRPQSKENYNIEDVLPVFDSGKSFYITIDEVLVWENGIEATIKAHFVGNESTPITFYDTHYLENKDRYYAGMSYMFDIYGVTTSMKVVPEDEWGFSLEGDKAVDFNSKMGRETQYDESGIPMPVNFNTKNLHMFSQLDDEVPEFAELRAPIIRLGEDIDFYGNTLYEIEIETPGFMNNDDASYRISLYTTSDDKYGLGERPSVGDPIVSKVFLQGKMRCMVDTSERPSTKLHTFQPTKEDGSITVVSHKCSDEERGSLMNEDEQNAFAKEVYYQLYESILSRYNKSADNNGMPDFYATRNRDMWVKADVTYNATELFNKEATTPYWTRYYMKHTLPVIVYINLYDKNGEKCQWTKGGEYTVKISYGSMLPDQKMKVEDLWKHFTLVQALGESFRYMNSMVIADRIHKDVDYRSEVLADPIITKTEFIERLDYINGRIKENNNVERLEVDSFLNNDTNEYYLELTYPKGSVDIIELGAEDGYITSIRVRHKKDTEE